jgi:2'-hydroxyisoflavone reductase
MDVLVLGGTSFVGRWIVEDLLARGHVPTLFSRGRTGAELFPGVARLVGDRDTGDYGTLAGGAWDAVVDVSGYVPRHVVESAGALADHRGRYLFVSTGLVYDPDLAGDVITESSPRVAPHHATEDVDEEYGALKVACEDELAAWGDRLSIVRPGYVVGPHDTSDRFTYWVRRGARGGRAAVPPRLERPFQVIDVRDLARLVVLVLEGDLPGPFNATGPVPDVTLGELLTACGLSDLVTVPEDALAFPLLLPGPSWDVLFRISSAAADAVGMPRTPLAVTVADTLAWDRSRGEPMLKAGPSADQEAAAVAQGS